ncbi:MAG TPA: hypothetical protein VH593_30940 [Ktedonobacteraceae bacterium]
MFPSLGLQVSGPAWPQVGQIALTTNTMIDVNYQYAVIHTKNTSPPQTNSGVACMCLLLVVRFIRVAFSHHLTSPPDSRLDLSTPNAPDTTIDQAAYVNGSTT